MNDDPGGPSDAGDRHEPPQPAALDEPPPLSAIRVKGPSPRGLNKPAIIAVAGGGVAIILVLATSGLSSEPSRQPAEAKPIMSDPARPEMARGSLGKLPATYEEAAAFHASTLPAGAPLLGPPMAGDMAAFAPDVSPPSAQADDWSTDPGGAAGPPSADPIEEEADTAQRSGLFFELRQGSSRDGQTAQESKTADAQSPPRNPLTALGPMQADPERQTRAADPRVLHPGAVIPASLVTAIVSEAPGPVIAQVTQSIHDSATGRNLLIPQGARLIGDYRSAGKYGQSRVAIVWSRLIMPDGREIALDEVALDPSGASGVKGKVNNHWGEVFGAAALGTLINIGVAATEETPSLGATLGGAGWVANTDPAEAALREGVQQSASIVTNRVVDRSLAIAPTIKIAAGSKVTVIVTRRLAF